MYIFMVFFVYIILLYHTLLYQIEILGSVRALKWYWHFWKKIWLLCSNHYTIYCLRCFLFFLLITMKRFLRVMLASICGIALSVWSASAASSDCLNVKFNNWDSVCLGLEKDWSRTFRLSVDENNLERGSSVRCYIVLPNANMYSINWCKGTFSYGWTNTDEVIVSATYVKKNDDFYSKRMATKINFNKGTWASNSSSSSSSSSSNSDEVELSTNRKSPSTNQYVNLTIETDKKYTGKLTLSAKYRSSSSSSWSSISNTSSTYFNDYSDEWDDGYYKMKSSDKGKVTLSNLVKFKKNGYYRIYVKDTDWNESYIQFNVGVSSSSSNSDDLEVKASPSNPDTYEWVKLTIETDDDYTGKINFSKFQYRSSSSSSWSSISRTSSTYVSDYSSEWSNWYYRMTSSDDGEVTLKNLVKFKKSGYYRIYVEDTDWNESYVQINVDTSSSSSSSSNSDEIELSTNRKSPSTNQFVNLTIETDDDYTGKINFSKFQYRSSSSSSWSSISNTSSTYFNDYSDEWDDGYYRMTSSDDGEVTLKNLVKFRKNGYYRIYVEDTDGNESYIQFNVGDVDDDDDDEESSVSGFTVSELAKIKKVYREWDDLVWELKRKYPSLKKDSYWIKLSDNLYEDIEDVVYNRRYRDFKDYDDFRDAFDDWYNYTMRNI